MAEAKKFIKVQGVLFFTKFLSKPNTHFDDDNKRMELCLGNLSDKAVKAIEELGVRTKRKDKLGHHLHAKSLYKFRVFDEQGEEVDLESVGDGTTVTCRVSGYVTKKSKEFGLSASVDNIQVLNLVAPTGDFVADDEEAL